MREVKRQKKKRCLGRAGIFQTTILGDILKEATIQVGCKQTCYFLAVYHNTPRSMSLLPINTFWCLFPHLPPLSLLPSQSRLSSTSPSFIRPLFPPCSTSILPPCYFTLSSWLSPPPSIPELFPSLVLSLLSFVPLLSSHFLPSPPFQLPSTQLFCSLSP